MMVLELTVKIESKPLELSYLPRKSGLFNGRLMYMGKRVKDVSLSMTLQRL